MTNSNKIALSCLHFKAHPVSTLSSFWHCCHSFSQYRSHQQLCTLYIEPSNKVYVTSSWLDGRDGDVIDRMRRRPRPCPRRERQCRRRRDAPQLCEQWWLGWFRELHMVADEHEKDAGHGGTHVRVFLHAEQADVVAPPRLFP